MDNTKVLTYNNDATASRSLLDDLQRSVVGGGGDAAGGQRGAGWFRHDLPNNNAYIIIYVE